MPSSLDSPLEKKLRVLEKKSLSILDYRDDANSDEALSLACYVEHVRSSERATSTVDRIRSLKAALSIFEATVQTKTKHCEGKNKCLETALGLIMNNTRNFIIDTAEQAFNLGHDEGLSEMATSHVCETE